MVGGIIGIPVNIDDHSQGDLLIPRFPLRF